MLQCLQNHHQGVWEEEEKLNKGSIVNPLYSKPPAIFHHFLIKKWNIWKHLQSTYLFWVTANVFNLDRGSAEPRTAQLEENKP